MHSLTWYKLGWMPFYKQSKINICATFYTVSAARLSRPENQTKLSSQKLV